MVLLELVRVDYAIGKEIDYGSLFLLAGSKAASQGGYVFNIGGGTFLIVWRQLGMGEFRYSFSKYVPTKLISAYAQSGRPLRNCSSLPFTFPSLS